MNTNKIKIFLIYNNKFKIIIFRIAKVNRNKKIINKSIILAIYKFSKIFKKIIILFKTTTQ